MIPVPHYSCKLFHVHACESEANFHRHLFFPDLLGVTHCMMLFCCSETSFNGLFPVGIQVLAFRRQPDVFTYVQIALPYMSDQYFLVIFACRTFLKMRTVPANRSVAFVFSVAVSVCCRVFQHLPIRT